jgi:RNA polymerase sigma-70 factor (ECF subfamily)
MPLTVFAALIDEESDLRRFERIYENYHGRMLRVALGILEDRAEAEDAVHEALLGIARTIRTVPRHPEPVIRAYVLTAARNAAWTMLPEKKRRDQLLDIDELQIPDREDLFQQLLRSQEQEVLTRCISALPQLYREVLLLRYVVGMKPKAIAQLLGRPTATVQQQLTRAKARAALAYRQEVEKGWD